MDSVLQYVQETIEKNVDCKAVIQACQRHLKDLQNPELEWRTEEAEKYIRFAERLHYYDDQKKVVLPLKLKPFQKFIIGSIFGWYRKNGSRRFSDAYIQIARKNGKSFLSAFFAICFAFVNPIRDGEIYCAGTEQKTAQLAWKEAKKFIEREKSLRKRFKIMEYRNEILNLKNHSTIKAISGNTEIDGPKPWLAIVDEYHLHKDSSMYSVLRDGQIGLPGALSVVITTAGFDTTRDCYRQYKHAKNVLSGVITQDNLFVFIAEADLPDAHEQADEYEKAVWTHEAWRQANPLILDTDNLAIWQKWDDNAKEAKELGGERRRDFIVKHLNCWRSVFGQTFVPADAWEKCGCEKTLQNFFGRDCIIGLDLSSKNDLSSFCFLFPPKEENEKPFVHSHSYLPRNMLEKHIRTDKAPYDVWTQQKLLTLTDCQGNNGFILDYKFILEDLKRIVKENKLNVLMICYDPMGASGIISDLAEICPELIEIGQYPKSMNDATRNCQGTILGNGLEYNKQNELLSWSIANAEAITDSKKQMIIDKRENTHRIDAVDSLLDAWKGWLTIKPKTDDTEEKADTWFSLMNKI